jgi:hypothetical protein
MATPTCQKIKRDLDMELEITEEKFEAYYKPIQNHIDDNASLGGCMFETHGKEMDYVLEVHQRNPELVWTFLEGDDGIFVGNGLSYVNRIGYIITEKGFDGDGFIEIDFSH